MKLLNKIGIGVVAILIAMLASFAAYETKFANMANDFFAAIERKDADATRSFLPNNGAGKEYEGLFNQLVPQGPALHFKADNMFSQKELLFTQDKVLTGTINPEGVPKPIPVVVLYVSENNVWKIKEVREEVEQGKPTAAEVQEKAKIMGLARQSMADFILSKKSKSMEHFYSTISDAWKKDTTVKKLNELFQAVLKDETDWSFLNPVEPNITKYSVAKDGVLTIVGVYPSRPKRLIFEQNFVNEDNAWKLAGFKLYTADAEPAAATSTENQPSSETTKVQESKQTSTPAQSDNKAKK